VETHLVFIHLGSKNPLYLERNISRTRAIFPEVSIVVAGQNERLSSLASEVGATFCKLDDWLGDPDLVAEEIARDGLDKSFWNGYWQKTFDRLLAIAYIHESIGPGSLVHIEIDVIVTQDFPVSDFANLTKIMWGAYDDRADIASIVSSPSAEDSRWLFNALVAEASADNTVTDMVALRKVREKYPEKIMLLPATPCEPFDSSSGPVIFDGLHIGEWLFGWDPKAHWGFKRRRILINPYSDVVAAGKFSFEDGSLALETGKGKAQIASLHIHSKELRYFAPDISHAIPKLLSRLRRPHVFYGFVPLGFATWAVSRAKRWTMSLFRILRGGGQKLG